MILHVLVGKASSSTLLHMSPVAHPAYVGSIVGLVAAEGARVSPVGAGDGLPVGSTVVGANVGAGVGTVACVGVAVGGVGDAVEGACVGALDGDVVGDADGIFVGASVSAVGS